MKNKNIHRRFGGALWVAAAVLLLPVVSFAENYSHYNKALEDYQQQIYLSAVSEAQAQIQETPNHAPSWRLIARIYLTLKKCPEASSAAAAAYNIMVQPPAPSTDAQADLQKILTDLEGHCGPSLDLGRLYAQSKDYAKAAEHYRGYLQKNPDDADVRLEFARNMAWAKNYSAAAEEYKRYLHSRPKDIPAILGLADVYAWDGDLKAAESQLKKVLALDAGNSEALAKLGHVYEWQGQYKNAADEYGKAITASPENESARDGQTRVKDLASSTPHRMQPSEEIVSEIQRTGELSLYLKLGDSLYFNDGKVDEALVAYRRFLREYPDDSAALLKVARVLGWEKRYDEAVVLFRQYMRKNPDDIAVHMELANILSWSGRRAEALTELEIIQKQNPSLPTAYVAAGDILRWQRNFPEARDNYRKVLKLDPDNEPAQDGLREIDKQWTAEPVVRLTGEKVSVSDIDFRRTSEGAQGEFHLNDGRIDLAPGVKTYQFKQTSGDRDAKEFYVNGGLPIENEWRWWGGAGGMQFDGRAAQLQASLGIEGTISTRTWVRAGYTREDSVFESNNLSALLSGESLQLNSYDFQFAQTLSNENQVKGALSAGFLTDGNSRTRVSLEGLHELSDAPFVKVGAAFKALSFAQASSLYWSPSAYSGPGVTAQIERRWDIFSYKADIKMFRIIQTSQTELSVEGGFYYQPRHGFFAALTGEAGRGAGAAAQGTTNTLYQDAKLSAGYKF